MQATAMHSTSKTAKLKDIQTQKKSKDQRLKETQVLSEERIPVTQGQVIQKDPGENRWMFEAILCEMGKYLTVRYTTSKVVGTGSFGSVFKAIRNDTGDTVGIKKVLLDKRYKSRELQIMRLLHHPNVIKLHHYFKIDDDGKSYLHLVLDYVPDTIHRLIRHHKSTRQTLPILFVKMYVYQTCRALAHMHSMGICHRDIKPQNLLVDKVTHQLYLCDFGSAKVLIRGEPNISYICSRYYRAPELIFGASEYTCEIDMWSVGCVMAEMLTGRPMFPGDTSTNQLVQILKILGTPSREDMIAMHRNYTDLKFPNIKAKPLEQCLQPSSRPIPGNAIDLLSKLFLFNPKERLNALQAMAHPFFDELRDPNTRLPDGSQLPPLFNWTPAELDDIPKPSLDKIQGRPDK